MPLYLHWCTTHHGWPLVLYESSKKLKILHVPPKCMGPDVPICSIAKTMPSVFNSVDPSYSSAVVPTYVCLSRISVIACCSSVGTFFNLNPIRKPVQSHLNNEHISSPSTWFEFLCQSAASATRVHNRNMDSRPIYRRSSLFRSKSVKSWLLARWLVDDTSDSKTAS